MVAISTRKSGRTKPHWMQNRAGWAAHGMVGFDMAKAYETLGVPEADYRVEAAIAVGRQADTSVLPEALQGREAPSPRVPAASFIMEGHFKV